MKQNYYRLTNLLIVVLSITTFLGFTRKPQSSSALSANKRQDQNMELKALFFDKQMFHLTTTEGEKLKADLSVKDSSGNILKLKNIAGKRSRVIFKYSHKDCSTCIDLVLDSLTKIFPDKRDVILISDSYSDKDFLIKTRHLRGGFECFNIGGGNLGLPIERNHLPFLFVLKDDMTVEKVFIPMKEFPDAIMNYLVHCKQHINSKKNEI